MVAHVHVGRSGRSSAGRKSGVAIWHQIDAHVLFLRYTNLAEGARNMGGTRIRHRCRCLLPGRVGHVRRRRQRRSTNVSSQLLSNSYPPTNEFRFVGQVTVGRHSSVDAAIDSPRKGIDPNSTSLGVRRPRRSNCWPSIGAHGRQDRWEGR